MKAQISHLRGTACTLLCLLACLVPLACVVPPAGRVQPSQPSAELPLHLFSYDRAASLEMESAPLEESFGVAVHAISYASPKGGRVTGRLFVPPGAGPFAGVILAHGMPGKAENMTGIASNVARHGAVVVVIDAPYARRTGDPITFTRQDSTEQVQLIVDLQRAVDLLLARPDVDPARLAYMGRSYGGATGALFAGVERRLKTYVLGVADGGITTRISAGNMPPPAEIPADQLRAWLSAMDPIEGYRFVGRANGSILFMNGRQDPFVTVERAEALHARATGTKEVRWYEAGHGLNRDAFLDELRWLAQTVGTTPPDQMPPLPPPKQ